ncbi:MAG: transcription termination factor NusA [Myxococcota bacterium]|jgi:N utilization substance protein A|nr:transcription termination factor NusA [Myxococcota bacterium]
MNLNHIIDSVGKDKGIEREILVETLKSAILTAARRTYGAQREIEAHYNEDSGEVELYQIITVEDFVENPYREVSVEEVEEAGFAAEPGDELLFQIFYREEDREKAKLQDNRYGKLLKLDSYNSTFGRIAAQTAKQVIIQRIREAERDIIYNEYKDRLGEMLTGLVRRFEKGNIIVDLGRTDAILPRREQTPRESYRPGDRIQAMIKEVQRSSRDPQVVITRADPQLLFELFELEVPEIHEGIVRIVAVAREPGVRSKVAVYSRDSDVDPVGACVGMRGSRVQAVVQELRGEKIDIVPYVEDAARFVCNAISPAEVAKVLIDDMNMTMELIVPDDQLSLAIGRGGQNVRLAAQLTGWNLDIISETRLKAMMAETRQNLLEFEGITEDMIDTLFTLGYNKLEHIAQAENQDVAQIPGFNVESAGRIIEAANDILARPKAGTPEAMTPEDKERAKLTEQIKGVGQKTAVKMWETGYRSPEHILYQDDTQAFADAVGVPFKKARQLWYAAKEYLEREEGLTDENFEERKQAFIDEHGPIGVVEGSSEEE